MALIIAGDRSGVGKTTVTLALLSYLAKKKIKVQSFKVGPDYIDPMFHTAITDRPCRNLDPVLTSETYIQSCFARHCQTVDYALIEGVMGLFDGVNSSIVNSKVGVSLVDTQNDPQKAIKDFASTAHIARLLNLPILLVLDCSRLSGSIAAIAHGFRSFDSRIKIAGIVLNRVGSDRHLELLKDALEPLQISILGVLRRHESITIPDRHLGLVPSAEIEHLKDYFDRLATHSETCFNWQKLLPLLQVDSTGTKKYQLPITNYPLPITKQPIRIAIARDRAFNFYYQDNLDILTELGAQLIPWSPLQDEHLPDRIQGLYFGGGFPEVFAEQLAENKQILAQVKRAIKMGMATYAECGGLMYLCDRIVDFNSNSWQMVGVLPTNAVMSDRLTLGYRRAVTLENTILLTAPEKIWGHEFHRSQLTSPPKQPIYAIDNLKSNQVSSYEGWYLPNLHASYIHLHFGSDLNISKKFLKSCTIKNP
ncbi:MAG: cobyrinate a,c-diamide synthase [Xenococcaceae cyanobacterium]